LKAYIEPIYGEHRKDKNNNLKALEKLSMPLDYFRVLQNAK
jgi:hypothetical protein